MSFRITPRQVAILLLIIPIFGAAIFPVTAQTAERSEPQQESQPEEVNDPLGRSTPHGTVVGFLQKAQGGHFKEAAEYLQLSKGERTARGEQIARQLHALMDSAFVGRVGKISDRRQGSVQLGIPQDHERIGVFRINGTDTDVDLAHVSVPQGGEIWLFSSEVLAAVPDLYQQIENDQIEEELPGFLVRNELLHTPLWRVVAFVLLIPICFGIAWGTARLLRAAIQPFKRRHLSEAREVYNSLLAPATLILTLIFHQIGIYFLGVPLLIRVYYQRVMWLILAAGLAWFVFPLINVWGERARRRTLAGSGGHSDTLVLLGQRILKVFVVIVVLLVMLSILGFDMTTAVAGLGIGSIAIAFAAQKTLENLLGGISILGDQVIRVGDVCRVEEEIGTVEDISLRSTRIRTLARTELSVPNGQLANMTVENMSRSDKSLFRATLDLRHETSSAQLRSVLSQLRSLLQSHSRVEPATPRVRFMGFGESSLRVELNCHILTSRLTEFLAIREELLLRIMDIVADAGIGFAFPSRVLYVAKDAEVKAQQKPAAEETVPGFRKRVS
jgi:MscS family membrane protein